MELLPKNLILKVISHLRLPDIHNVCLTGARVCSSNFWYSKRLQDYPLFQYPANSKFSELEKFRRLYLSGYLYVWGKNLDSGTAFPKLFLIYNSPVLTLKVVPFYNYNTGMYILTYSGELYLVGTNLNKPKLLARNLYDFFTNNGTLFLCSHQGNIWKYDHGQVTPLWTSSHVKKFAESNNTNYFLTTNNILYINSIQNKILNVKDFVVTGTNLYYLGLDYRLYFRGANHVITHIKSFVAYLSDIWYIDIKNDLYQYSIGEFNTPEFFESNVRSVMMDRNNIYYITIDGDLYKYRAENYPVSDEFHQKIYGISNVLNFQSVYGIKVAIVSKHTI